MKWANCGTDCPMHPDVFNTDDTLKVTHHIKGQKETMIAVKLCAIMSYSLLLIAVMVKVLGISGFVRNNYHSFLVQP